MSSDLDLLSALRALKIHVVDAECVNVDVSALASPNGVPVWQLDRDAYDRDIWHHGPAGTSGPLAEMLAGIAWCYVRFPDEAAS